MTDPAVDAAAAAEHVIFTRRSQPDSDDYQSICSCQKWQTGEKLPRRVAESMGRFHVLDEKKNARAAARRAPLRTRIDRLATISRTSWYTAPVRDAAVRMLDDMLIAAGTHGATLHDFDTVTDLAGACLDIVATKGRRGEVTAEDALGLIGALLAALTERSVDATRTGYTVKLTDQPGPVLSRYRYPLVISLHTHGWDLSIATAGSSPVAAVYTPPTIEGAEAIADMVAALAAGELPDPFSTRP